VDRCCPCEAQTLPAGLSITNCTYYPKLPLKEDQNLLDALPLLTEEERLAYIEELSESQNDAAVHALNGLVTHHDITLKNAAIDGLLLLLEFRTGHFDSIVQSLDQNHAYLSDEQAQKFYTLIQHDQKP
jgi:hypothetical protein